MVMPAFLEADDSEQSVLTYRDRGELWVLFSGTRTPVVRGHVLVLPSSSPDRVELVNLAISDNLRGRGMGSRMLTELMARLREQGVKEVCLSTATADTDALHFYQRLGFRFSSVERDVFTGERGYPGGLAVRGVPVLDRIWLDRSL
jgi:ribosomal protein S18 acetylase RimI-like enzyme